MTTEEIRLEEDRVSNRTIALIIAVSLVVVLLSVWLTWAILVAEERAILGDEPRRAEQAPNQISRVRQTLIDSDREGILDRRRAERSLDRYEWVDRERGQLRIPIRRAMELRARGARP